MAGGRVRILKFFGPCRCIFTPIQNLAPMIKGSHFQRNCNKMSVCKTVMPLPPPPYCHIDTGSGKVHQLISTVLIGKYRRNLRKE